MTTPSRHNRAVGTFDPRSRQILTTGGTVVGGNGATYKYDPLTGMATVVKWPGGTAAASPAAPAAAPAATAPVAPTGEGSSVGDDGMGVGPNENDTDMGMTGVSLAAPVEDAEEVEKKPAGPTPEEIAETARKDAEAKARRDAAARLKTVLTDYGLESLADVVWGWLVEGLSEAEIVQRMRETTEFKTRFPAIEERKRKGLTPISPGEYVAYERQARQLMRAAGLPEGYYDSREDFTNFLNNDLSLSELGDRVTLAANAAFKMPKEARDKLTEWGMGPGDLTAFWLDPDKAQPLLERKYAAAQLAGAGTRTGWGNVDEGRATELATLGVTEAEAQQGFGNLVQSRELFTSLDRGEDVIGQDEQLGAAFTGNAAAQRRIEQRRRRRQAQFEAGGSFASGQTGVSGLGDTSRL